MLAPNVQSVQNVRPVAVQQFIPISQLVRLTPISQMSGGFTASMAIPAQIVNPAISGGFGTSISSPAATPAISTVSVMSPISGGFGASMATPAAAPVVSAVSGGFTGSLATPMAAIPFFQQTPAMQTGAANVANLFVSPLPSVSSVSSPFMRTAPFFKEKSVIVSPPVPRKTTAVYTTQYTPSTKTVVYESDNYPTRENMEVYQAMPSVSLASYPSALSLINTANYIKSSLIEKFLNSPFSISYKRNVDEIL